MNWDIFDIFAYRQEQALAKLGSLLKGLLSGEFSLQKTIASLLAIIECFGCVLFDTPLTPDGQKLDLSGYELVFEDEFEGTSLDKSSWFTRGNGARRSGYNAESQVQVKDGNLVITGEYLEDGEYGEGWYVGAIALNKLYCKGYFEIRCICNSGTDFWSAFWIQAATTDPYDHYESQGGVNGAEIDIFESLSADRKLKSARNAISSTIHCNGVDDDIENIDSLPLGKFKGNNIYEEYNTYGLEWTDDEYIFYVNGVETARSSFGKGVCEVPEQVIVSLEIPGNDINFDKDYSTAFTVDYVRIYEKK